MDEADTVGAGGIETGALDFESLDSAEDATLHAQATQIAGSTRSASSLRGGDTWDEAVDAVLADLAGEVPVDLAIVFADSLFGHHRELTARLQDGLQARHLIGCTGQSVIGAGIEAEEGAALSVMTLRLPHAKLTSIQVIPGETREEDLAVLADAGADAWLIFADPFSLDTENLVRALQARLPDIVLLGGMASSHNKGAGTAVFLDGRAYEDGAVLLGVSGLGLRPVVAQGAEPLGRPLTITSCEKNIVHTIGSRPAMDVLKETMTGLDDATRDRVGHNLLVGLAIDEYREQHDRGDFLIRNIVGIDRQAGSIAIGAVPRVGQTFQFQFRDATAADDDLREQLEAARDALASDEVVLGSVLCACNGRGQGLFGTPNHDAAALTHALGELPTTGFFCNGEIGPVGGGNFLHGFTASIALLTATNPATA
jgi:small ligand-binding sensory domain FIST